MSRLEGKVAVVTGAGTGVGHAIARLYAEHGAKVVVADIRPTVGNATVAAITSAGGDAIFVEADVSQREQVAAVVAEAERHYGALHVMTANAGALGRGAYKPLAELAYDEIEEIMAINFFGVLYSFKEAIPAIRRAGGGAMTVTASISAHRGKPDLPIYAAAKGGVVALVKSLAIDLMPAIRVNAVTPGAVMTQIGVHTAEAKGLPAPPPRPDKTKYGGVADPREIAHVHLFLASDEASYVNGHSLVADGGQILMSA